MFAQCLTLIFRDIMLAVGGTQVINSLPHQSVGNKMILVVVYVTSIVSTPAQDYFNTPFKAWGLKFIVWTHAVYMYIT